MHTFIRKSLQYAVLGTGCILTALLQFPPSDRDGKFVSTSWLSNNTWRWENVRLIAAQRRTERSSLQLDLRVGGHLALADFHAESELSHMASRHRCINILYIIVIIIIKALNYNDLA